MISPPRPGDAYPGLMPPVWQQWARHSPALRAAVVGVPVVVVVLVVLINRDAGATLAVLFAGVGAATAVYAKNRTDRHNAAVERGEIATAPDPHFQPVDCVSLPAGVVTRLGRVGYQPDQIGRVVRFDGGWIVRQSNPRDVALVVGEDGGWARFDPRVVTDLWAVTEYRAGRGHEPDR